MYGKIFDNMYDGTLYGHWEAIVTFQQMIVLATPDGVIDMTPQALAARTSIPFDIIVKGIKVLSEPDPYTRTPGEDGRRIVLMDDHRPWGWRIVNHGKYMRLRNIEQKRTSDRSRIAAKRKQIKDVANESPTVAKVAHSDSDSDSDSTPTPAGGPLATPVAAAFKAYQDGIKARYQGDYPPSAKANGQLAQVVGRVGAANAVTVVQAYLAHAEPFYAKTKHSLDFLVRDCEKIWVELQAAAGAAAPKAPTTARVALLRDDGTVIKELDERPAGDMLKIAIESAKRYSTMIANLKPKYVGVRQGPERRRFPLEELRT